MSTIDLMFRPVTMRPQAVIAVLAAGLRLAVARLRTWRERARERRQLLAMDDRALRDIGISRVDALREANKPVWRC